MTYQYQEKMAVAQDMLDITSALVKAYSKKITNKSLAALIKKITTRRNVIQTKYAKRKRKATHQITTVETIINEDDKRISFACNHLFLSKKRATSMTSEMPFIISDHAVERYFERTVEVDYMADYHSTLTFLCMSSLMDTYGYSIGNEIIVPCESGLLFGKIKGHEEIKHSMFSTNGISVPKFAHFGAKAPSAAKIILTTFVSHNEMYEDQTLLWERMMTFYDKYRDLLDDILWMCASIMEKDDSSIVEYFEAIVQVFIAEVANGEG